MYPTTWIINRTFSKSEILAESLIYENRHIKITLFLDSACRITPQMHSLRDTNSSDQRKKLSLFFSLFSFLLTEYLSKKEFYFLRTEMSWSDWLISIFFYTLSLLQNYQRKTVFPASSPLPPPPQSHTFSFPPSFSLKSGLVRLFFAFLSFPVHFLLRLLLHYFRRRTSCFGTAWSRYLKGYYVGAIFPVETGYKVAARSCRLPNILFF